MNSVALRRGKETQVAFMLVHTVLLNRSGRKLPATLGGAEKVFDDDKKLKMVRVEDGETSHYEIAVGTDVYELYAQRN